jgi:UDP-glucuronate 4-epimerase
MTPAPANPMRGRRVFVTGSAGFIGFHLCRRLLDEGAEVTGLDAMTAYYDPALKARRHALLGAYPGFRPVIAQLEDAPALTEAVAASQADLIIHLAAQAGVRYSLEAPATYVAANVTGTFNLIEAARQHPPRHLMLASTSSVYGANAKMPFAETDAADRPLTIYAATKLATEAMAHSYAHLWGLPVTMFRFFTVYGPWGRPDMALFGFVKAIVEGRPIDVFNHGRMFRDFTYVDDLVVGIRGLIDCVPPAPDMGALPVPGDSLSPVAPFRIVNIGNGHKIALTDFIDAIERALGRKAERRLLPMQKGDVPATWADNGLLQKLTGAVPETPLDLGVKAFVDWYLAEYSAS